MHTRGRNSKLISIIKNDLSTLHCAAQGWIHSFRVSITRAHVGKPGKAKAPAPKPTHATIFIAGSYAAWQKATLRVLSSKYDPSVHPCAAPECGFAPDTMDAVKAMAMGDTAMKPMMKKIMVRERPRELCGSRT